MFGRERADPGRSGAAVAHHRGAAHRHADLHHARRMAHRDPRAARRIEPTGDRRSDVRALTTPDGRDVRGGDRGRAVRLAHVPAGVAVRIALACPVRLGRPRAACRSTSASWRRTCSREGHDVVVLAPVRHGAVGAVGARGGAARRHHVQPIERADRPSSVVASGGSARSSRAFATRRRPRARAVHAEHVDVGDARGARRRWSRRSTRAPTAPGSTTWRRRCSARVARRIAGPDRGVRGAAERRRGRADRRVVRDRAERRGRRAGSPTPSRRTSATGRSCCSSGRLDERKGFPRRGRRVRAAGAGRPDAAAGRGGRRAGASARSTRLPPTSARGSRCSAPCPTSTCRRIERPATSTSGTSVGGESFGVVLVEAMAAGSAGGRERHPRLRRGRDGRGRRAARCRPRDPAALAAAAGAILDDPALAARLAAAGPSAARRTFDWTVVGARLEALYGGRSPIGTATIGRDAGRLDPRRRGRGPAALGRAHLQPARHAAQPRRQRLVADRRPARAAATT